MPAKQKKSAATIKSLVLQDFSGGLSDKTEGLKIFSQTKNVRYHDNSGLKSASGYSSGDPTAHSTILSFFYSVGTTTLSYDSNSNGAIKNMATAAYPGRDTIFTDGFSVYAFDTKTSGTVVRLADNISGWRAEYGRVPMTTMVEIGTSNSINVPIWTANTNISSGQVRKFGSKVLTAASSSTTSSSLDPVTFGGYANGTYVEEVTAAWGIDAWQANTHYTAGMKIKTAGGTIYRCSTNDGWSGATIPSFTDTNLVSYLVDNTTSWSKVVPTSPLSYNTGIQQTFTTGDIIKVGNNYWYASSGTLTSSNTSAKAITDLALTIEPVRQTTITEDATGGGNIVWAFLYTGMRWTLSDETFAKNPVYHFIYGKDRSASTVPYGLFRYSYDSATSTYSEAVIANTSDTSTDGLYFVPQALMTWANRVWCINKVDGYVYFSALGRPDFTFNTADDGGYIAFQEWLAGYDEGVDLAQYQGRFVIMCRKNVVIYSGSVPQGEGMDMSMSQVIKGHGLIYPGMWVDTGRDIIFCDTDGIKSITQSAITGDLGINTLSDPIKLKIQPYIDNLISKMRDQTYTQATGKYQGIGKMEHDPLNHCIYIKFGYETTYNTGTGECATFIYDYKFKTWSGPWMTDPREYQMSYCRSEVNDIVYVTGTKRIYRIGDGDFSEVCTSPTTPTYVAVANPVVLETAWIRFTKESNVFLLKMLEMMSLSNYPHPITLDIFVDYDDTNSIGSYTFTSSFQYGNIAGDNPTLTLGNRVNPRTVLDGRGSAIKLRLTQTAYTYDASISDYELQINRLDLWGMLSNLRGQ